MQAGAQFMACSGSPLRGVVRGKTRTQPLFILHIRQLRIFDDLSRWALGPGAVAARADRPALQRWHRAFIEQDRSGPPTTSARVTKQR